jgi:hypothetical protein
LARLEDPNGDTPWDVSFTRDGSRLLVCTGQGIQVWDLRRIRAELAQRDLDWDAPPYPPASVPAEQLTMELDLGDFHRLRPQRLAENLDWAVQAADHIAVRWFLRGRFHHMAGRYAEALKDSREAVAKQPDRAKLCNELVRIQFFRALPRSTLLTAEFPRFFARPRTSTHDLANVQGES